VRQSRLTTGCKENGGLQARDNGEPFPWLTKIHSIACEPKSALGVKSLGGLHKRRRRSKCYVSARHAEAQPPNPNPGIDPRHAGRVFHQPAPTAMSFDNTAPDGARVAEFRAGSRRGAKQTPQEWSLQIYRRSPPPHSAPLETLDAPLTNPHL